MGRSRDIADFLGKTEANNTTKSFLTSAADGAAFLQFTPPTSELLG
jgi:hypothetical protein